MPVSELGLLIKQLNAKEARYRDYALRTLHEASRNSPEVYSYWSILEFKLLNRNPCQRLAGIALLSENVKWDEKNRMDLIIDDYLALCEDENFEVVIRCIQSLPKILSHKPHLRPAVMKKLEALDVSQWEPNRRAQLESEISALSQK